MRYVIMGRWPVSPDGQPVELNTTYKEVSTKKQALAMVKLLLDEVGAWQISVTDREQAPVPPQDPKQQHLGG